MQPMLACKAPDKLERFPYLASPKLDGVRAIVKDGVLLSRNLKPIRNKYAQALFGRPELEGFDGELIVGAPVGQDVMQRTTSGVMAFDGEPDVTYWVFDMWNQHEKMPFGARFSYLKDRICAQIWTGKELFTFPRIQAVPHISVASLDDLAMYEEQTLEAGYEGVMLRDPDGLYKHGRATAREGSLMKLKRFEDAEARVVGFEERKHNANEATTDELGHTKRSKHAENLIGHGDLGALIVEHPESGKTFGIGSGFTAAQRVQFWACRDQLAGRIAKYKHFANSGVKDVPRFPVFLGFRDPDDV